MSRTNLLNFVILFSFLKPAHAQDFEYKAATLQEVNMQKYNKDTSAHAVVLNEFGLSRITTKDGAIRLEHEYHVKIKVFDHKAFSKGTIEFRLRNNENNSLSDEVEFISGITTYIDDNNVLRTKELDPKLVYKTTDYKYQRTVKFAMPGLTDGCVIEYKYKTISPFFTRIRDWEFQGDIPKIYSECEVHIPAFWKYSAALKGGRKLTKEIAGVEYGCFSVGAAASDCAKLSYGMSDIPAFKTEEYMTSPKNFMAAVTFNLIEYTNPFTDFTKKITTQWSDVEHQLKIDPDFGGQLKRGNLLKERMQAGVFGITDQLAKAKAVYAFVQKYFKWNKYVGIYCNDGLKTALENHSGNIAEINLALVTALNSAGLSSDPVLLSTRDNGVVNKLYPVIEDFNYVVAKTTIEGQDYLLDATDPLLPFGMLPLKCMNGQGRAFNADKPSYWVDLNTKQKRKNTYLLNLTLLEDGKIKGILNHVSSGYEAYEKRKTIKSFNDVNEYVENLERRLNRVKIIKTTINNIDSLDLPVEEIYEVEINAINRIDDDKLTFNPNLIDKTEFNPFRLSDRTYPVDMGTAMEDKFILNLSLPAKYTITNIPGNTALSIPGGDGKFFANFSVSDNTFTYSRLIQFNKAIYTINEYPYLKELFNTIILSERSEVAIQKKSESPAPKTIN